jgi:hypothetical protein
VTTFTWFLKRPSPNNVAEDFVPQHVFSLGDAKIINPATAIIVAEEEL